MDAKPCFGLFWNCYAVWLYSKHVVFVVKLVFVTVLSPTNWAASRNWEACNDNRVKNNTNNNNINYNNNDDNYNNNNDNRVKIILIIIIIITIMMMIIIIMIITIIILIMVMIRTPMYAKLET
jgi:hypothetical protein